MYPFAASSATLCSIYFVELGYQTEIFVVTQLVKKWLAQIWRRQTWNYAKGTFTLCPCQNQFQYPLQFPCPSHRLHWIRIHVSFRLNFMSTTASPDVKVWLCIGTCKIRIETDVRISFSRSGDRSKRNGRWFDATESETDTETDAV